jgi:hypothetical protein
VDLSTGVPQVSIPLHTVQSSKLSYPIILSYHGSGVKVNDVAGALGAGWSLNFSQINRIMRNRPDEQVEGFFSNAGTIPDETDPLTLQVKNDLSTRAVDMMPDLFYYNTGVSSGTFIFDNQVIPRTLPQRPLKIATNTSTLSTFTLTDPSGTNFEFEAGETATATMPEGAGNLTYIASWYLSRIVSADKLDTIRFNYTLQSSYSYTTSENLGLDFFFNVPVGATSAANQMNALNSNVNITVTGTRYLSSIEHRGGKVSFSFSGGRTDDPDGKKLDQIVIYSRDPVSNAYQEERRIIFSYSYFQNTDSGTRLRLDSFREKLGSTTYNPPYTFTYSVQMLPAPGSTAQDYWGYYNGAESNNSLIPAYTLGTFVISTNDREVHPDFVQGCVLRSIINPAGGITEYTFESNNYLNGPNNAFGPGLRVSKIIRRDPFTSIIATTNYDYTNPSTGNSSGLLVNNPSYFIVLDVVDHIHGNWYYYDCLLIKMMATGVGNFSGSPVIYEYVTTYTDDDVNSTGKTVSRFSMYTQPTIDFPYFPVPDNSWAAGNLLSQEIYKVQSDVSTLVKKIENTYDEGPDSFTIKGLSAARNKIFFYTDPGVNDFIVKNYVTYSKFPYLKETKVYDYEQNSGTTNLLRTVTNFYEETDKHLFPTRVETTTSVSGEKVTKEFTYVADYPTSGVLAVMNNLNMTGLPVDVTTSLTKGASEYITSYQKTEYYEWETNKAYPRNFYDAKIPLNTLKGTFELNPGNYTRLSSKINAYESGITVETEVTGDQPRSIIVDRKINRVVASSNTSSSGQIAYSGFESSDFGNWSISTGTTTITNNRSLNLTHTFETIPLQTGQTINYTYTVTRSNGPLPELIFSKEGAATIEKPLTGASGSGSVTLTAGDWNVNLEYDFNVTEITVNFSYQYTYQNSPSIVSSEFKTGRQSLTLGSSQTLSISSLPSGTYTVAYYQKGGAVTLTATGGATVLSTTTGATESDGWTKVLKEISISSQTQGIQISGTTSIYIDELRLHPSGAFMTTTCYDMYRNIITQTDPNLRSQYIEYDDHRRISLIRDHEKNILQHYDYELAID